MQIPPNQSVYSIYIAWLYDFWNSCAIYAALIWTNKMKTAVCSWWACFAWQNFTYVWFVLYTKIRKTISWLSWEVLLPIVPRLLARMIRWLNDSNFVQSLVSPKTHGGWIHLQWVTYFTMGNLLVPISFYLATSKLTPQRQAGKLFLVTTSQKYFSSVNPL